jgi:ABC-type nitrate/sulfonate/bicarbonate transport system permease component
MAHPAASRFQMPKMQMPETPEAIQQAVRQAKEAIEAHPSVAALSAFGIGLGLGVGVALLIAMSSSSSRY